ncbi:MAG TPA: LamG domain-containing protein [Chitinophagaceae bacterium]|nr:LamG domain-containing protein [Chitinophagaceae bacterium]
MRLAVFSFAQQESFTVGSNKDQVVNWWCFDKDTGNLVSDKALTNKDSLYGNYEYVNGIIGNALKLDGFRTYVKCNSINQNNLSGAFTIEAWIALASYPWSWSPIVDCSYSKIRGFFLGIDQEGHVGFNIAAGSSWYELFTQEKISLKKWNHIAVIFEPDKCASIFINGKKYASVDIKGHYIPFQNGTLTIGRNNAPQTWNEYQLTTKSTYFFLDGILDEIKITSKAKTLDEISNEFSKIKNLPVPALSDRSLFPKGPVGPGNFGAFYTKLNYYKEWDDLWRVSEVPDVFIRFDQSPVQMVFWRGTSFVPCWVTENNIWYTNEWLETWGSDVASCAEPLMDRQCRYSHVRIIENTDARVVIHWRYALADAFYNFVNIGDDGNGEWCDEFYTIYPDMVGVRKMELHYSKPERKHDWEEQIVVLPPGKYPDDVIDSAGISLVNMSGDLQKYSWHDKDLKIAMPEPKGANMSYVNLKSKFRPFFIVAPGPVATVEGKWDSPFFRTYSAKLAIGNRQDPVPSVYGWWNHWPVAPIPGDGRWVSTPDRPSHFTLTTFDQWNDYEYTKSTRTRIMLQGMTDKEAAALVPLAKSWLQAPAMKIISGPFKGGTYDQSERAYLLEKTNIDDKTPCSFILEASNDAPLINPAIIIKNWGGNMATLYINGHNIGRDKDFRQGIRKGTDGDDLILWIKMNVNKPVKMELKMQVSDRSKK